MTHRRTLWEDVDGGHAQRPDFLGEGGAEGPGGLKRGVDKE